MESALTNTVTAVPWSELVEGVASAAPIKVANSVNPNGIMTGDSIVEYEGAEGANGKFRGCKFNAGTGKWDSIATVTRAEGVTDFDANKETLPQGSAFWFARSNPTDAKGRPVPYYLVGRYTGDGYDIAIESAKDGESYGYTLCPNPTMRDVDLNDLVFVAGNGAEVKPNVGDRIATQTPDGMQLTYFRNAANTQWGRDVATLVGRRVVKTWTPGGTIPAGTGFWYMRAADTGAKGGAKGGEETLKIRYGAR